MYFHPDDTRYDFAVHVTTYADAHARAWSQHRTLRGAIRSARSIIGGRKHRVRDLSRCRIWCKRSNRLLSVAEAEAELS